MAKRNPLKPANGSAFDFEAQPSAGTGQAMPASHLFATEYNGARSEGLFNPKSEWFIKDEPKRAKAAEKRDECLVANIFWLPL